MRYVAFVLATSVRLARNWVRLRRTRPATHGEANTATGPLGKAHGRPAEGVQAQRRPERRRTEAGEQRPISLGPRLSPRSAISGDFGRQAETIDEGLPPSENPEIMRFPHHFRGSCERPK